MTVRLHTAVRRLAAAAAMTATLGVAAPGAADEPRLESPRWTVELKGGRFEPDLDDFDTFYGDDDTGFGALAVAYRLNHWLEVGGELGYASEDGRGELPENQLLGGEVTYRVMPAQAFVTLRGDFSEDQLFVPYAGVGIAVAFYEQEIEDQSDRRGYTDPGLAARVGIALSLNRLDPVTVRDAAGGMLKKTYAFLEAQQFSAEHDGDDLGGVLYLLGLRLEFDGRSDAERLP